MLHVDRSSNFHQESPVPFPESLQPGRKRLIVAATCHGLGNATPIQRHTRFQFNSHRLMQNDEEEGREQQKRTKRRKMKTTTTKKKNKKNKKKKKKRGGGGGGSVEPLQGSRRPRYSLRQRAPTERVAQPRR